MGRVVLDQPAVDQLAVGPPAHLLPLVERHQRALHLRQPVERHAWEVVMLEVVVRIEVDEIPEPVPAHEGAPFRGIRRIDVVVLSEPVQREGDRKDEEDRDDARAQRRVEPEGVPDERHDRQVEDHRQPPLARDRALERRRIRGRLTPRGAEIDREERR
jgi:hypothetical protein